MLESIFPLTLVCSRTVEGFIVFFEGVCLGATDATRVAPRVKRVLEDDHGPFPLNPRMLCPRTPTGPDCVRLSNMVAF